MRKRITLARCLAFCCGVECQPYSRILSIPAISGESPMFHVVRFITVCCTALMLLVQPVYANSAVNCGCQSSGHAACSKDPASCCCCLAAKDKASKGCPHCQESKSDSESADAENMICHCGDSSRAPNPPADIPEKSGSDNLNLSMNAPADSLAAAPMIQVAHAHPQLLAVAALVNNFTQVAYCVWLI